MTKKKETQKINNKNIILLLSVVVLIFSLIVIFLPKTDKIDQLEQKVKSDSQYSVEYKHGVSYTDSVYGVKIEFPEGVNSYKYKEYKWPSHLRAYNPIFEKTFASDSNKFNFETGNFYLDNDNVQTLGNLISYKVHDIKKCEDSIKDSYEDKFCENYAYSTATSGKVDDYKPYSYWIRNNKYVIFFGIVDEDIQSKTSVYNLSLFD
mgnify:CR=1 FL=1